VSISFFLLGVTVEITSVMSPAWLQDECGAERVMLMQQSANLRDYAGEVSLVSPYRFIKAAVEVSLILSLWRSLVYYALVMCRAWLQDECGVVRVILTQRSANLRTRG
jgi:hypothetical protein